MSRTPVPIYGAALSRIQSAAYGRTYAAGFDWLLDQVRPGPLFDIGCGDGSWAAHAQTAGLTVTACEPNPHLATIARAKGVIVQETDAQSAAIPDATYAITAMGEVLCYTSPNAAAALPAFLRRIARLPAPTKLIADLTGPDTPARVVETSGEGWSMQSSVTIAGDRLTRAIDMQVDGVTAHEVHTQKLFSTPEILILAEEAGLDATVSDSYGPDCPLLPGRLLLIAQTPG